MTNSKDCEAMESATKNKNRANETNKIPEASDE
jgi:hypothetical protein